VITITVRRMAANCRGRGAGFLAGRDAGFVAGRDAGFVAGCPGVVRFSVTYAATWASSADAVSRAACISTASCSAAARVAAARSDASRLISAASCSAAARVAAAWSDASCLISVAWSSANRRIRAASRRESGFHSSPTCRWPGSASSVGSWSASWGFPSASPLVPFPFPFPLMARVSARLAWSRPSRKPTLYVWVVVLVILASCADRRRALSGAPAGVAGSSDLPATPTGALERAGLRLTVALAQRRRLSPSVRPAVAETITTISLPVPTHPDGD
jgi:hypothetical protein